jgi:hypothetical protein
MIRGSSALMVYLKCGKYLNKLTCIKNAKIIFCFAGKSVLPANKKYRVFQKGR